MSHPEIKPNLSPQPPLISPLCHFPVRPGNDPLAWKTQMSIFSPSCMKTKLSKTKYKLRCANEKYNGVKRAFPIRTAKSNQNETTGSELAWLGMIGCVTKYLHGENVNTAA